MAPHRMTTADNPTATAAIAASASVSIRAQAAISSSISSRSRQARVMRIWSWTRRSSRRWRSCRSPASERRRISTTRSTSSNSITRRAGSTSSRRIRQKRRSWTPAVSVPIGSAPEKRSVPGHAMHRLRTRRLLCAASSASPVSVRTRTSLLGTKWSAADSRTIHAGPTKASHFAPHFRPRGNVHPDILPSFACGFPVRIPRSRAIATSSTRRRSRPWPQPDGPSRVRCSVPHRVGESPQGGAIKSRAIGNSYTLVVPAPSSTAELVVAISSRALFDFEEENLVFETEDDRAYMQLQLARLEQPAKPGVAYRLVKKLLGFNADGVKRVDIVILSRNDPVSGLRVFRSVKGAELGIERGVFTRGRPPYKYLNPLRANLFLSANADDVRAALAADFPAALVYTQSALADSHPDEVRIAFDGDAVLFADEAERLYRDKGLEAFQTH